MVYKTLEILDWSSQSPDINPNVCAFQKLKEETPQNLQCLKISEVHA